MNVVAVTSILVSMLDVITPMAVLCVPVILASQLMVTMVV